MARCNELCRSSKVSRILNLLAMGLKLDGSPIRGRNPEKLLATRRRNSLRRRAKPEYRYAHRLKVAIRNAVRKNDWGTHGLPWAPKQLRDHIESKLAEHDRRCPDCRVSLDMVGFHIDHIVPISSAATAIDLVRLSDLDNLDVRCPRCNMSKHHRFMDAR